MRIGGPAAVLLLGAAAMGAARPEDAPPPASAIERQEWKADVPAGRLARVDNPHGDVRVRSGGPGPFEVIATLQQFEGAPRLRLQAEASAGGVDVAVVSEEGDAPEAPRHPVRADLTVFVPRGVGIRVATSRGLIEAKGLDGALEARSHDGEVRVTGVRGSLTVDTDRGDVVATLDPAPTAPVSISSTVGDVTVYVADAASARVRVETSGEISTDFSIAIEHRPREEPDKLGSARLGSGGTEIVLQSRQGHLRLLRLPKSLPPAEALPAATKENP